MRSKLKNGSQQCGVHTIEVTPAFMAAEIISSDSDMVRAPSSTPGRIWQCTSRIAGCSLVQITMEWHARSISPAMPN